MSRSAVPRRHANDEKTKRIRATSRTWAIPPAVLQQISIRLPAPDIAAAQKLARKKGVPYLTYIKTLLHDALQRELGSPDNER